LSCKHQQGIDGACYYAGTSCADRFRQHALDLQPWIATRIADAANWASPHLTASDVAFLRLSLLGQNVTAVSGL
jgi:hypothetical protein